ncbi:hypothetical protein [Actinoplanes sp. NPDC026619]|uniref:hypothetical protein n=1 Tax=Actinoplanes sp. NPDC026619 TaxID=3155798 RepID=UPI00340B430E
MAGNQHAAAIPTIGAFTCGYLLVVPTAHTTSIGRLPRADRRAVHALTEQLAGRLSDTYDSPVIGFEYGLNMPTGRRVEHGHQHLLPSTAGPALRTFLSWHLPMTQVTSMEDLPGDPDSSYISVYEPGRPLSVYPVANNAFPRIRLREVVALLDPRVPANLWDWQIAPFTTLMQATVDHLSRVPARALTGAGRAA